MRANLFKLGKTKYVFFAILTVVIFAVVFHSLFILENSPAHYSLKKTVRYSFLVVNDTAEFVKDGNFEVFAPVKQNSYQTTLNLSANHPFELNVDHVGNQTLKFKLPGMAPYSRQVVNVTAKMALAESPQPFEIKRDLLSAEKNIEVNSPEVAALASKLGGQGELTKTATSWLYTNVLDAGYMAEDRGALFAITQRKGDCTEFASAFVALTRASGIPARMVGGFMLEKSGRLTADNYHNWAEFEQGNRWNIADPQNNILGSGYGSYISFYNFDQNSRMKNSHRFLSYDARLSVQML